MRAGVWITIATLACGCDQVFLGDRREAPDASASIDATETVCAGGAAPIIFRAPLLADAVLIDPRGGTAQAFGGNPNVYLNHGSSIKSVGLWRFSLAGVTAPQTRWTAAHVMFEWLARDEDCGPGCGACDAFEEPGVLELYPVRDQWDEATASWTKRTATTAWSESGAAGTDRGPFAARANHVPRTRLDFTLDPEGISMLAPWIDPATDHLSVVVVPKADPSGTNGARMIIPALPARTSCSPPSPPAVLEIEACP